MTLRESNTVNSDLDLLGVLEVHKHSVHVIDSLIIPASLTISEEYDNEFRTVSCFGRDSAFDLIETWEEICSSCDIRSLDEFHIRLFIIASTGGDSMVK